MASVSSIKAGGGYCYPCLMETDGKDYCRYYEYESVYRETEPSIVLQIKACEPRGYSELNSILYPCLNKITK